MNKVYQSTVEYNDDYDEYCVTIPEDMIDHVGWESGDVLEWHVNKDGTVLIERVDEFFEEQDGEN
jgi:bifunctional DNA-binding transcriptional regulator/antitoxin component of YhaV-PrlF toxin-antitoxin module